GANPSDAILLEVNNDPSNFGDPINLQVAIYESSDNTCTGSFTLVSSAYNTTGFDEMLVFSCPKPNTTYYIMVDGVFISATNTTEVEGWFGLEVTQLDVAAASELRCTAEFLGSVPLGGSITSPLRTNACSMNSNAAPASAFGVQKSVWFTFTPPLTGHVFLQGTSSSIDPIGIQLGVYQSSNNGCTGTLTEVESQYTAADNDELIELHCLDPGTTYFVMVDGAPGVLNTGIFTLTVTDAGNETPQTNLNPVVCFGGTFAAGGNIYSQTGIYNDTLQLPGGCDSIVVTNLTVLADIQANLQIMQQGAGLGNTTGQIQANPSGGAGGYSFVWSNGQTTNLATNLVGGNNYCVTITDQNGCQQNTCLDMPYYINFIPSAQGDSLACNGDQNGVIEFAAIGGVPPYQFEWQNAANTVSGSGLISFDGQVIVLTDLPGGQYSIHIADVVFDTTVVVEIWEPTKLQVGTVSSTDASCFGVCDGAISVNVTGGIPPYQVSWSNGGIGTSISNLCDGNYTATVTDANGCTIDFDEQIQEPQEFIATASQVQPVSCFAGTDGEVFVTTNSNATSYLWSNNAVTPTVTGLPGGSYAVTVTNAGGCTATASVTVATPNAPVGVTISQTQGIICQGGQTGILQANVSGPGSIFSYIWSNGGTQPSASTLAAGSYSVTISNENGCMASSSASVTEPTEIQVVFSTNQLSCLDPADGGIVTVEQVSGGVGPYSFSSDGFSFDQNQALTGFVAGPNIFYVQDAGGCVREFGATIEGPQQLVIDLGNDESINLGESVTLEVSSNQSNLSYLWSPAELLSCADCRSPLATPLSDQIFSVTVTDEFGCTASDDVFVEVNNSRKVYIPNAFSPNGDGFNDLFVPFVGASVRTIKAFNIFDRQGNQVYTASDFLPTGPGMGWDGVFKGKEMQPAVFVWMAQIEFIDGQILLFKGDVALLR
ncbi:MAG: gliding motility-associated C-terminal domain-containing protein, partial [Bacteroidetes bacterium]|nr:gliding motility-associated C-terminal domain-containing protein [Bacteroidota bacterium]